MLSVTGVTDCTGRLTNGYSVHLSTGGRGDFLWRQPVINNFMAVACEPGGDDGMLKQLVVLLRRHTIMLKITLAEMVPGHKTVVSSLQAAVLAMPNGMPMESQT